MAHQQARFLPHNIVRAAFCTRRPATVPYSHLRNDSTAICGSPLIRNGLPHLDGLETTTVFGGIRQPFFRESCTRMGCALVALIRYVGPCVLGCYFESLRREIGITFAPPSRRSQC